VGGHPDDPESGCGGTLARYTAVGHTVTIIYLTRGEVGIQGKAHEEAAAIRSRECEAALLPAQL
jgi:LmbE family N-acetylglucosaminyl deacetylase